MRRHLLLLGLLLLAAKGEAQDELDKPIGDAWTDRRNPIVTKFQGERLNLWSLKPIKRPALAPDKHTAHPIDQLIARQFQNTASFKPISNVDRRTLARRLHFALLGLAPSYETVEKLKADDRPDAWNRFVDSLLSSPAFGEHFGRMWLDVVRYSDSNGFDWDEFRPTAWRFRDYVIRSFNEDKPFDRFVLEQLAGDEIAADPPQTIADQEALIATGYLRLGPHDNAAPLFNEEARSRAELEADLTETTASTFLGMTMTCCRCHDHKTDPLSHQDHYRLRAFFAKVKFDNDRPLDLAHDQVKIRAHNDSLQSKIDEMQSKLDEKLAPIMKRLKDEKITKLNNEDRKLLDSAEEGLEAEAKSKRERILKKTMVSAAEARKQMDEADRAEVQEIDQRLAEHEKAKRPFMKGLIMGEDISKEAKTFVLEGGDHRKPLDKVVPGFVSILDPNPAKLEEEAGGRTSGRRIALARWLTSPQNPLTARVMVNRIWQVLFGEALVATPNDFGFTGTPPPNPELLDYLASELIDSGWSVKHVVRLIVTSEAFQQPCDLHQKRAPFAPSLRRLSAEQLRDAVLDASCLLLAQSGGAPIWPELPADLLNANPALLDDNETKTKGWYPSPADQQDVRSIYLIQKRTVKLPHLETFDLPDNSVSCGRRLESIAAPQALTLLNGELMERAAQAMELRVLSNGIVDESQQVRRVFEFALQRAPTPDELASCTAFLRERSLKELCRAILNTNEFCFVD